MSSYAQSIFICENKAINKSNLENRKLQICAKNRNKKIKNRYHLFPKLKDF